MSNANNQTVQAEHKVLPPTTNDEFARQEFVRSYKQYLVKNVHGTNQLAYEKRVKPKIKREQQRDPKDRFEVRDAMVEDPHYQMFSALLRTSQEMLWSSCQIPVQRNLKALNQIINKTPEETARILTPRSEARYPALPHRGRHPLPTWGLSQRIR